MAPEPVDRPNILLIAADHLRTDSLGCYGAPAAETPAFDSLARQGWRFDACYTACATADQSLAWLLAGGPPSESGANWLQSLHRAGYRVDVIGCGEDADEPPGERADMASQRLHDLAETPPFCLVLHLGAVTQLAAADRPATEAHVPPPIVVPHAIEDRPRFVRRLHHDLHGDLADDRQQGLDQRRTYYGQVAAFDNLLAEVLEALDQVQAATRTLVAVCGLNGCMLGDHELASGGPIPYEHQVNVPLVIRHPGELEAGHVCRALCQLHDLAGTLLEATGTDSPSALARSRLPTDHSQSHHARCAMSFDTYGEWWSLMIRQGYFKLILYHTGQNDVMEGELFDLEHDWSELNSLWDLPDYWQTRVELTERALDWLADVQIEQP